MLIFYLFIHRIFKKNLISRHLNSRFIISHFLMSSGGQQSLSCATNQFVWCLLYLFILIVSEEKKRSLRAGGWYRWGIWHIFSVLAFLLTRVGTKDWYACVGHWTVFHNANTKIAVKNMTIWHPDLSFFVWPCVAVKISIRWALARWRRRIIWGTSIFGTRKKKKVSKNKTTVWCSTCVAYKCFVMSLALLNACSAFCSVNYLKRLTICVIGYFFFPFFSLLSFCFPSLFLFLFVCFVVRFQICRNLLVVFMARGSFYS